MKKTYTVTTRQDEDSTEKKTTVITVDSTGATEDQLFDAAARALIVTAQSGFRRNGSIPATFTILVKDVGTRQAFVATPDSIAAKAQVMSKEEKLALIKKIQESLGK